MKILHVYKDYPPVLGGIEKHIQALAESQAAVGDKVTVLVTHVGQGRVEHKENGVRIVRAARLFTFASTPLSIQLPLDLRAVDADLVHLHFPYPPGEIAQFFLGGSRPFVITYHSDIINPRQRLILGLYRPLLKKILLKANRILPTSPNYMNSSPYLAPIAERCEPVPLGIDPEPFLRAKRSRPRKEQPSLLFVGRHRYYKGVPFLLEALQDLPVRLLIVGDGPERPKWERHAEALDLSDRVIFAGEVPERELPGIYASADIFVLPAHMRAEAFGVVLLEAMAAGLPCVTSELGTGTSFVVQHGRTGLVVPPGDPQALAAAVRELIGDSNMRREMGGAGQARVLHEFTLGRMVKRVDAVYRQVLGLPSQSERVPINSVANSSEQITETKGPLTR